MCVYISCFPVFGSYLTLYMQTLSASNVKNINNFLYMYILGTVLKSDVNGCSLSFQFLWLLLGKYMYVLVLACRHACSNAVLYSISVGGKFTP